MRSENGNNGIGYGKWLLVFFLVISLYSCLSVMKASAESIIYVLQGSGKVYDWKDVMNRYESYGMDYQINLTSYQLEAAKALTADETYSKTQTDYLTIQARIQELNLAKESLLNARNVAAQSVELEGPGGEASDNTGLTNENPGESIVNKLDGTTPDSQMQISDIDAQLNAIEVQLASYQQSAAALSKNASDDKLSRDLADFYKDYQGLLTQDGKHKVIHSFMQNCLNLMVGQEQMKYDSMNQEYINLQKQIEEIKYQYGYSTKGKVDEISLNLSENTRVSAQNQENNNLLNSYIKQETGLSENDTIQYNILLNHKNYIITTEINSFVQNTPSYLQLKNMETSYQNYLTSGGITNTAYQNQIGLTIKSYQLQEVQLQRKIGNFVRKAINSYDDSFRKMTSIKQNLEIADNKCKAIEESQKYKKASKLEVKKAYLDRQSVSLKYYSSCMEVLMWEDILENNIYLEDE